MAETFCGTPLGLFVAMESDEVRKSATVAIPGALGKSYKAVWCNKLNWELIRILA
jgi:hypothetical protein